MKYLFLTAVGSVALALGGCSSPMKNVLAPDFELKMLDGSKVALSTFRGRPVLVSFWGST